MKKLAVLGMSFCMLAAAAFGVQISERVKLGAMVESASFIGNGPQSGKVVFVDGWGVYLHDPSRGTYERAFSTYGMGFGACPRGIAYLSQGLFAGNFLLSDVNRTETLYLCSPEGDLLGVVRAEGTGTPVGEGLVQITSGPDQGRIARLAGNGGDQRARYIFIFRLEQGDGEIRAVCERRLTLPDADYVGIAFLPAEAAGYPNSFVVSELAGAVRPLRVIDGAGQCVAEFAGAEDAEALTYFSSGPLVGKLLAADAWIRHATVRSLDGSVSAASTLHVGPGVAFYDNSSWSGLTWLKDRQQLYVFGMFGGAYATRGYLVSRQAAGLWRADAEFPLTHYIGVRSITDITREGTHKLLGWIVTGNNRRAGVDRLDSGLRLLDSVELPIQYKGLSFGNLVYVPGDTLAGDRYVTPAGKVVYAFDSSFLYPAETKDISGLVTNAISKMCYDPGVRRFYVLDGQILRIFDSGWRPLAHYDLTQLALPKFSALDKITSGDLRGHVALLIGADQEVVFVSFEYQIAGDLLQSLIDDVEAAGLDKGRTNSLVQKLRNAKRSAEEQKATPAMNQIEAFRSEVSAQTGKDIPAALAEKWMTLSEDILRGLRALSD